MSGWIGLGFNWPKASQILVLALRVHTLGLEKVIDIISAERIYNFEESKYSNLAV